MKFIRRLRRWLGVQEERFVAEFPTPLGGSLYASPMPYGPYDTFGQVIDEYDDLGIDRAVVLVTDDEIKRKCKRDLTKLYEKRQIAMDHAPWGDLISPSTEVIDQLVPRMVTYLQAEEKVAVHCNAGVGRTGIVVACLLRVVLDCTAEEAISEIKRHMRPDLTAEQMRFVREWNPGNLKPSAEPRRER